MNIKHHAEALVVSATNAAFAYAGAFDFLRTLPEKLIVAFLVAVVSGAGYQLGRVIYGRAAPMIARLRTKLTGRRAKS